MLLAATPVSGYSCAHQNTSLPFLIYNVDMLCLEAGNILETCNAAVLGIHRMCSR
jgi:hypothetical protein